MRRTVVGHCTGSASRQLPVVSSRSPRTHRCSTAPMAFLGGASSSHGTSGSKRPGQELERRVGTGAVPADGTPAYTYGEVPVQPVPLKYVVQEAVKRWFEDTYAEATRGDVKQQALLGQMYAEGYGCEKDPKAAQEWTARAAARGYRMKGVYCEL